MNSLLRRLLLFALPAVALLAIPLIASANNSWAGYHWAHTSNPFTLKLGDNVSSNWDSYLATTSLDWSASTVLDTTIVAGQGRSNCRPTSGRVEVCNKAYGPNGWLGVAQVWISGSHITQGTVKVNDTYFNTATYNTPAWRNLVMCQEVGHTLGLTHQDENFSNPNLGTCMDYTSSPGTNQHPNQHDYEQLELIYAHLDTFTTINSTAKGFANADLHAQDQWGRLVSGGGKGQAAIYHRDFGGGHHVFTFVYWAE